MLDEHGSGVFPGKQSQTVPLFAEPRRPSWSSCRRRLSASAAARSEDGERAEERDERAPGHAATVPAAVERAVLTGVNTWSANGRATTTGWRRLDPEQLVRLGNAAYGAGLCLLMLGEREEAAEWLGRASARWRESWEHATPTSWGRPIGAIKAALIAGDDEAAAAFAAWALGLGCTEAESPIGRYAATLALLVERSGHRGGAVSREPARRDDFPPAVADALAGIAAQRRGAVRARRSSAC